jgi:hypothetical protein
MLIREIPQADQEPDDGEEVSAKQFAQRKARASRVVKTAWEARALSNCSMRDKRSEAECFA